MENLNKIIMVLLVVGLVYLILNQEKYLTFDYLNIKKKNKKKKKKGKKKKKENDEDTVSKKKKLNANKKKTNKNRKKNKNRKRSNKTKIDLIEIDELDKLSFEDLNSNITLGTLDTSISNDGLFDELTMDTMDNELNTNRL
jgi:hypothetical protein